MPSEAIDRFLAELEALAEKHGMSPVKTGFRHLPDGRLLVSLVNENKQYPWGSWYIPVDHPKRMKPKPRA